MTTYVYRARDPMGNPVKGTMEATTQGELATKLHKLGYMVTRVSEGRRGLDLGLSLEPFQRISTEDLVIFNVQLSNLIHAGISLLSSLSTLIHQIENKRLRKTIGDISRSVEAGESFSESLSRHPKVFPKLFISMVKAGEASGKLDQILTRYAAYSEQQADLKQKIKGALFYPLILLGAGVAVTLFIVTSVIPQFAEIFNKVGVPLPLPTRILYQIGMAIQQFWHSLILFGVLAAIAVQSYTNTPMGRLQLDWLKLKLPLFGILYRKVAISRFARTLGMLLSSGVPLLQSLDIVREIIGNEILGGVIRNVYQAVEKGEKISEPLAVNREFPPDAIRMIAVGEETGSLDEMLGKIADFYDRSVGYTVKKLTTVIEPVLLAGMGALVGFIMASLLLPMFDMIQVLRH